MTVPPFAVFATAHLFCAPREGLRNSGFVMVVPAKGRCLLLLLRIRSVHLEILGFPMGGAY